MVYFSERLNFLLTPSMQMTVSVEIDRVTAYAYPVTRGIVTRKARQPPSANANEKRQAATNMSGAVKNPTAMRSWLAVSSGLSGFRRLTKKALGLAADTRLLGKTARL